MRIGNADWSRRTPDRSGRSDRSAIPRAQTMAKGESDVPLRRVKGAVTDASGAECPQRRPHSVTIRGGKTASADQRRRDIGLAAPTAPVQRRRVRGQRRVPVCSRSSVVAAIACPDKTGGRAGFLRACRDIYQTRSDISRAHTDARGRSARRRSGRPQHRRHQPRNLSDRRAGAWCL